MTGEARSYIIINTMQKHKHFFRHILLLAVTFTILLSGSVGYAATNTKTQTPDKQPASTDISGEVTQSYNADKNVQVGMVVKLKEDKTKTVVPLTTKESKDLLGVVVSGNEASIVLTPENVTKQQVLVATTGSFNVLVSNQGGPIKAGDYLAVSALSGIAMKASAQETNVIGRALSDFSGTSNVIGNVQLSDSLGRNSSAAIGRVKVDLRISINPLYQRTVDFIPAFVTGFADGIANKPVSVARIYLSTVILIVTAFVAANMMYSGIRNGMVAVGRNPLSKKSIIKSLIQTVIAGLIIFLAGIFGVYLLLKL